MNRIQLQNLVRHEYESGKSFKNISRSLGFSYEKIRRLLKEAGGHARGMKEAIELSVYKEVHSNERLVELIDGLMLSDGSMEKSSMAARVCLTQTNERVGWIRYIHSKFVDFGVECHEGRIKEQEKIIKNRVCKTKEATSLRTHHYSYFLQHHRRWYGPSGKLIPIDIRLSPLSLAQWYCGDGTLGGNGYRVTFCTDGFSYEDVEFLILRLKEIYDWHPLHDKRNRILLCRETDRNHFIKLVEQFIPDCFSYKLRVKTRTSKYKVDKNVIKSMIQLRKERKTYAEIAGIFNMSRSGVCSALARENKRVSILV